MARVRAKDYDDKQREILRTAAELFASRGFHNASMAELAQACGSSKARLYHYYPSKEALLHHILVEYMRRVNEAVASVLDSDASAQDALRELARALMQLSTEHHNTYPLLFREADALPSRQREQIRTLERDIVRGVTDLLARVRPDLVRRPHYRTPLAMTFLGAINWTYHWFDRDGSLTADQFADLVSSVVLGSEPTATGSRRELGGSAGRRHSTL